MESEKSVAEKEDVSFSKNQISAKERNATKFTKQKVIYLRQNLIMQKDASKESLVVFYDFWKQKN